MVEVFDFKSSAVKVSGISIKIVKKYRKRGIIIVLRGPTKISIKFLYCFKSLTVLENFTHFIDVSTFPPFDVVTILGGKHLQEGVVPYHSMLSGAVTTMPDSRGRYSSILK